MPEGLTSSAPFFPFDGRYPVRFFEHSQSCGGPGTEHPPTVSLSFWPGNGRSLPPREDSNELLPDMCDDKEEESDGSISPGCQGLLR